MTNPRCLWLTRRFPYPANSGEYLYSRGLAESLARAGAEVTGLCWARKDQVTDAPDSGIRWVSVPGNSRSRFRSLLYPLPADAFRHGRPPLRKKLRQLLREGAWDAVVIDHAAMGWALDDIRRLQPGAAIAYVSHNAEAKTRNRVASTVECSPFMKPVLKWDAKKYHLLERRICRKVDFISAITPEDAEFYREFVTGARVTANGPGYNGPRFPNHRITASLPRKVVMSGSFEWIAKQHNLLRFLEVVDGLFGDAKVDLQIVGKAPPSFVQEVLRRFPRCSFAANVPSVSPFLSDARMGVIPEELGGGFKLKALDYLFHGLPLALLDGAAAGLPLDYERDVLSAPSLEELARRIVLCIDDHEHRRRRRAAAHAKCDSAFSWDDRGQDLLEEIQRAASRNATAQNHEKQTSGLIAAGENQEA